MFPWIPKPTRVTTKTLIHNIFCNDLKTDKKPEDELRYKDYRTKLYKLVYVAERDYHEKCLEENKHNSKTSWKILKGIIS